MKEVPYWDYQVMKDEKGYFGMEFRNHPTPSGCVRYLPTVSDSRRWKTPEEAKEKFYEIRPKRD